MRVAHAQGALAAGAGAWRREALPACSVTCILTLCPPVRTAVMQIPKLFATSIFCIAARKWTY
jgi:hypothetical protein